MIRATAIFILGILSGYSATVFAQKENAQIAKNTASLGSDSLTVTRLIKTNSTNGELYLVSFQYEFPSSKEVFIRGFGPAPSKGSFKYFTDGDRVDIFDSKGGNLIASHAFTDALITMSPEKVDVPREEDFPAAFRRCTTPDARKFEVNLFRLLNQYFPKGYVASGSDSKSNFITMFTRLNNLPSNLLAEVALKIVHPIGDVQVDVYYVARERRSRSEWRPVETEAVEESVNAFLNDFISKLERK